MTITYHAGNRIQGLSTDTVETLTYSNVYSTSTGLVASNSQVSVTGGVLQILHRLTATNDSAYYDLSSYNISDTAWTLRFKFNCSARSSSASNPNTAGLFYLSSTNDNDMTSNGIGLKWMLGGGGNPTTVDLAGGSSNQTSAEGYVWGTTTTTGITSAGTTKWIEITRNGSTIYLKIYSDAFVTLQETVSATFTGTISGLKYLSYKARNNNTASWTATFNIDDLYFYNGVTSVNSKPTNVPTNSRFEETDTRKIYYYGGYLDGLGSSVDGVTEGTITQNATGKVGSYAWTFNGSTGAVTTASTSLMPSTFSAMTINVWLKPSSVRSSYAIGTSPFDGNTNNFFSIVTTAGGKFQPTAGSNANQDYVVTTSSYSTSSWQMVTLVYDGSLTAANRLKAYFNGAQEGTSQSTAASSYTQTTRLSIGKQGNSGQAFYGGDMDEASFWNRALSASEITALYNSGSGATPQASGISLSGLKAYYNFEQTSGNLINQAIPWSQVN